MTRPSEISSLPEEVLSSILDLSLDVTNPTRSYITYSTVSRLFRETLINSRGSSLWTRIESSSSSEWIDLQLRRSGEAPLKLIVRLFQDTDAAESFWTLVKKHAARVKEMQIHSSGKLVKVESSFRNVTWTSTIPRELEFTSLEAAQILDAQINLPHILRLINAEHPLRTWKMPNLRHLVAEETIFSFSHQVSSSLASLSLRIRHRAVKPREVLELLGRVNRLETLLLDFWAGLHDEEPVTELPTINMYCLRSLDIRIERPTRSNSVAFRDVMAYLHIPTIEKISIRLTVAGEAYLLHRALSWLQEQPSYHLKHFIVNVSGLLQREPVELELETNLRSWVRTKWASNVPTVDVHLYPALFTSGNGEVGTEGD